MRGEDGTSFLDHHCPSVRVAGSQGCSFHNPCFCHDANELCTSSNSDSDRSCWRVIWLIGYLSVRTSNARWTRARFPSMFYSNMCECWFLLISYALKLGEKWSLRRSFLCAHKKLRTKNSIRVGYKFLCERTFSAFFFQTEAGYVGEAAAIEKLFRTLGWACEKKFNNLLSRTVWGALDSSALTTASISSAPAFCPLFDSI